MSRSISRTLTHLTYFTSSKPTTRFTSVRYQSTKPDFVVGKFQTKEEVEMAAVKKLEDAIHRMIVKKSQPDWLPLVPGGSFWVPPKTKTRGFTQVVAKLVKDSTSVKEIVKNDRSLGLHSNRGWPSSAHFFKGATHSPLEGEMTSNHPNQSEEEEG